MPPPAAASATLLLSPAELNYLHTSLSQTPPLRPDGRAPTQFRPLVAESALLPATNGSARVCWSEGEECIVGVKCEAEPTPAFPGSASDAAGGDGMAGEARLKGDPNWVSLAIEIPGFRDDDALPVFLASLLTEALVQSGYLARRLVINERWHWRVYIDILLLSTPLSYPLPLLSMTIHLALLDTKLPRLASEQDDDPLFDDDWAAAVPLYSRIPLSGQKPSPKSRSHSSKIGPPEGSDHAQVENPPITLLTTTVNQKILFDPSREEIAVADAVIAISLASSTSMVSKDSSSTTTTTTTTTTTAAASSKQSQSQTLTLLSIRTIDSPARTTTAALADADNPATNTNANTNTKTNTNTNINAPTSAAKKSDRGIWTPPVGGIPRGLLARILALCVGDESSGVPGVAGEVVEGLKGFVGGR